MWSAFARAAATLAVGGTLLALMAFVASSAGAWRFNTEPTSDAQPCLGGPDLVPTLFGNDITTQIRMSTPDLKSQRVLRTEPANRLPGMFQSLLSVSRDGARMAYVTADDEQLSNARVTFIEVAHPETPHVIASEAIGMLPIRPVWSLAGDQLAFVVERTQQGHPIFKVLAASTTGGPVLDITTLSADEFSRLNTNVLCVTPAGAVSVLPAPAPATDASGILTPAIKVVTPSPTPTAEVGGGTRCTLPALSQNDPRWKNHKMRPSGESVGQVGCAVTSAAIVLDYYNANLTPSQLSDCLGSSAVPIYWSRAASCTGGRVSGAVVSKFSWPELDAILAAGRPAIVGMLGGQVGTHFVVVTSGGGDIADRYHIVDPWNGRTDGTLGGYTRSGWTLHQLIDYGSGSPGCGKLLITTPDSALKAVSGVSDGALYNHAVKLDHHGGGAEVTVERLSHDPNKQDQVWRLGNDLDVTADGNYRVIVRNRSGAPTVLSFTIDHTPPTIGVKFFNQIGTQLTRDGSSQPVLSEPGRFQIVASDPLTGITSIQATLDGTLVPDRDTVAGIVNRTLMHVVILTGPHKLTYSATNAAGLTASGSVTFVVQTLTQGGVKLPTPPSGGSGSGGPPLSSPTPTTPTKPPPPPPLACQPLTSAMLTDTLSGSTHVLTWNGNGTCTPFAGTIVATYGAYVTYNAGDCVRACPANHWVYSSVTYQINGASGTYQDTRAYMYGSVKYLLTLKDAFGDTATASAT